MDRSGSLEELLGSIRMMEGISKKIHGILDRKKIIDTVCDEFKKSGKYDVMFCWCERGGKGFLLKENSWPSKVMELGESATGINAKDLRIYFKGSCLLRQVVEDGKSLIVPLREVCEEILPPEKSSAVTSIPPFSCHLAIITPIRARKETIGAMCISSESLDERLMPTVVHLSEHISSALELVAAHSRQAEIERRYKEKASMLQRLMDTIPTPVFYRSKNGIFLDCNKSYEELTGLRKDEIIGKTARDVYPPDTAEEVIKKDQELYSNPPYQTYEIRLRHSNGTYHDLMVHKAVITNEEGDATGLVGVLMDITSRKEAELELAESERAYKELVESSNSIIFKWDKDGTILSFNSFAEKFFGFSREEVIGKKVYDTIVPKTDSTGQDLSRMASDIFANPSRYMININENVKKSGEMVWIQWTNRAVYDESGNQVAILSVGTDITDMMLKEKQLRQYSIHLSELVEEKTQQLREAEKMAAIGQIAAAVGHDLKTPLQVMVNAIYLASDLFDSINIDEESRKNIQKYCESMKKQVNYMSLITTDLQDFARHLKPEVGEVEIQSIIDDALSAINLPPNVIFEKTLEEKTVKADRHMIKRVFVNLINNAIQAMPNGGKISFASSSDDYFTSISITDTGVGISKENMKKLFNPLFTTKSRGTGLGLAICKRIIDAHNGTISVESEVAKGSTFTIKLPKQTFSRSAQESSGSSGGA